MTRSSFMKLMLGALAMPSVATGCDLIGPAEEGAIAELEQEITRELS